MTAARKGEGTESWTGEREPQTPCLGTGPSPPAGSRYGRPPRTRLFTARGGGGSAKQCRLGWERWWAGPRPLPGQHFIRGVGNTAISRRRFLIKKNAYVGSNTDNEMMRGSTTNDSRVAVSHGHGMCQHVLLAYPNLSPLLFSDQGRPTRAHQRRPGPIRAD